MMDTPHTEQWCTFFLHDLYVGLRADSVREMIHTTERTRVPLVSPLVHGLVNLRGEIVTTFDLRRCLGFPAASADAPWTNVVVRVDDTVVSLVVDAIGDVLTLDRNQIEPLPVTVNNEWRSFIDGVFPLADSLMLAIDLDRFLAQGITEPASNNDQPPTPNQPQTQQLKAAS
ncbi:MAG: chemotaxis protein CheW [Ilumatobacter sp.]